MDIILISGKQGSGKTTLQKELSKTLFQRKNKRVETVNFADIIYKIHDFSLNVLGEHGIKRDIVKDGTLLQLLGTEWGRNSINENVWPLALRNRIIKLQEKGVDVVIIGDCRFENEFFFFPDALRIRLTASEEVRKLRCSQWRNNTDHPSEIGLDYLEMMNYFDATYDTALFGSEAITELVIDKLIRQTWLEKRSHIVNNADYLFQEKFRATENAL